MRYGSLGKENINFTDEIYEELKQILKPAEICEDRIHLIDSLENNSEQEKYINLVDLLRTPGQYKRKIRGLPGGGKTLTLLSFAANAVKSDTVQEILYLTYNITLVNNIKEYMDVFAKMKKSAKR